MTLLWLWIALNVGFLAGCWWNGRSYDRGYEDGRYVEHYIGHGI